MSEVNGRRPGVADSADARGKAVRFAWQRDAIEDAAEAAAEPVRRTPQVRTTPPPRPSPKPSPETSATHGTSFYNDLPPSGPRHSRHASGSSGAHVLTPTVPEPATDKHRDPSEQHREERKERSEKAFAVPPPGGRLAHGRGGHLAVRVAIAMTACLLLLGCAFIFGMLANRVGKTHDNAGVSPDDLSKYHVDAFPLQSAAAVAERYTRLCLNAKPSQADSRSRQLRAIISGDMSDDCGWNGRGKISATDIAWTGQVDPMPELGAKGRYLHMQAALGDDGRLVQFVVPVYAADPDKGTGVRIAGAPGVLPRTAAPSPADTFRSDESRDTGLAQRLMTNVLPGFFAAWGRSSAVDVDRYRTTDATDNVRAGMGRIMSDPQVRDVTVPIPDEGLGGSHTWESGDTATVLATVQWKLEGNAQLVLGYRLTMVRNTTTASGWSIKDIAGGLPDTGNSPSLQDSSMPTAFGDMPSGFQNTVLQESRDRSSSIHRRYSASARPHSL